MKTIILAISLTILNFASFTTNAQTYTTESKSCGSCQGEVSINSRIGDKCPHCGVTWGRKTTTHTKNFNSINSFDNSYDFNISNNIYSYSTAMTSSNCNVRSNPSTSAAILGTASAYQSFDVVSVGKNWVQVKVSIYDSYLGYATTSYGWIHKSLVTLI